MNFSNTCRLKKGLSLLLIVLMAVGLFSGCKKESSGTEPNTAPSLNLDISGTSAPTQETVAPTTEPIVYNDNMGTVTNQISVRVIPSKDANITGVLDAGTVVEILRQNTVADINWGMISSPVSGWICMDYVKMFNSQDGSVSSETTGGTGTDATTPAATTPSSGNNTQTQNIKGVITATDLNIRDDASTSGNKVGTYSKGDVVTILETKNGWGRTSQGWIKMDYVNTSGTSTGTTTGTTTNTGTTTTGGNNTTGNGSTTAVAKGIVNTTELNIRSSASTDGDRVGSLKYGDRVEILEKSGNWGRTSKGWISLNYVYQDGTTGSKTAKGIVTTDGLRIRSGPGTTYESVGSYSSGDRVQILEQFTFGDSTWGCTSKGWISMGYVYQDGTDVGKTVEGTVNADELNVRGGPGTGYDSVSKMYNGEVIKVLYQVTVGDTTWGCTKDGWVSLKYVDLDSES